MDRTPHGKLAFAVFARREPVNITDVCIQTRRKEITETLCRPRILLWLRTRMYAPVAKSAGLLEAERGGAKYVGATLPPSNGENIANFGKEIKI